MSAPWLYRASQAVLTRPVSRYWSLSAVGAERVPRDGPLLLAVNHASYVDPWIVGALFPRRPIRFLINEPWFRRSPLWRVVFRGYGVLVARNGDPESTLRAMIEALEQGAVVGIFPEGRISHDGTVGRGRPGLGIVAARTGVPVVPCGVRGAFESIPKGRRWPRRVPISLHIGEPLGFGGAPTPRPDPAAVALFVRTVMDAVRSLAAR